MGNIDIEGLHVRASDALKCCRIKSYPGGLVEIMAAERPIFSSGGFEAEGWALPDPAEPLGERSEPKGESGDRERARRRAAAKIRDYALCNDFKWFVTLTFDAAVVDRYSYAEIKKKLKTYCDNAVRRKGLKYILVPEFHKDKAIHFHGFFNEIPGFVSSGTYTGGAAGKKPRRPRSAKQMKEWIESGAHEVFNLSSWKCGFSTGIRLYGDYESAIAYVIKYVRKCEDKIGGRWYLSGGGLASPAASYWSLTLSEVGSLPGCYTFSVAGNGIAIWRGRADELPALLHSSLSDFDI